MGTTVRYNDVYINDCETLSFNQEVAYDESQSDTVYSKFTISVRGTVHADQDAFHGVWVSSATLTSLGILDLVQGRLSQSRKTFVYSTDAGVIIACDAVAGSATGDLDNGPKPKGVVVTPVGQAVFRIEFTIEFCRLLCLGDEQLQTPTKVLKEIPVLSNRWAVTEAKDDNFFTTRTTEGVIKVKHWKNWPHTFRHLCIPPLQAEYKRERMQFRDTPDGLHLRYTIVDKQKYASPPAPATNWYATYSEGSQEGGHVGLGSMNVILDGPPGVNKQHLVRAAVNVLLERLRGLQFSRSDDGCFLQSLTITEHLHEPRVQVNASVIHNSTEDLFLNTRIARMSDDLVSDQFIGYDKHRWPVPAPYAATKPAAAFAHYWQDPCINVHGLSYNTFTPTLPATIDNTDRGNPEFMLDPIYPAQDFDQDNVQDDVMKTGQYYSHYLAESDYDLTEGRIALPTIYWMSPPTTAKGSTKVLKLHSRAAKRKINLHAERINEWPVYPRPIDKFEEHGIQYTLMSAKIYTTSPLTMRDGRNRVYRSQLRCVYAMSDSPDWDKGKLVVGIDRRDKPGELDKAFDFSTTFADGANP